MTVILFQKYDGHVIFLRIFSQNFSIFFLEFLEIKFETDHLALQYEKAGRVGILRNSQMIFAYIIQLIFTDAQLNLHSVIGASMILIASLVIGLRKLCK